MKPIRIICLLLLFVGCKAKGPLVEEDFKNLKKLPSRKIIKNHEENRFKARTLDARLKVQYVDNKNNGRQNKQALTVRLRMIKDSVIWVKGTKVVNAFRAKITPESFSYYSGISKEYFTGDYRFLKELLGVEVTFEQLQNLFLGQSLLDLSEGRFKSEVELNAHKLTPKKQEELYTIFYYFYANNFRIKKQMIMDKQDKVLTMSYPGYILKENEYFPKKIDINVSDKSFYTFISMDVRSVEINQGVSIPYRIPKGYKELVFPDQ